jgi:hypothetical protein
MEQVQGVAKPFTGCSRRTRPGNDWKDGREGRIMRSSMSSAAPIIVISKKLSSEKLASFMGRPYDGMVKFVVDIDRRIIALGGEMHADAEAELLDQECRQESLWGGNYYPGRGEKDCIQFTSLINMRPSQRNLTMNVEDAKVRETMRAIVFDLVGRGEALP